MSKKMVSFIGDVLRRLIGRIVINPHKPLPMPLQTPWQWIEFRFFHGLIRRRIERDVDQTKSNYATQLIRIREKIQSGKQVRVLFLVSEISKWKGKSLYFALQQDSLFCPIIGLTAPVRLWEREPYETDSKIKANKLWFEERGYKCVELYDALKDKFLPVATINPDIVFYPEVWYMFNKHSPVKVSRFALTCYIPYFVPNYVILAYDCCQYMHRLYWRHIVVNDDVASLYRDATKDRAMAGDFVALGHPMIDEIIAANDDVVETQKARCVIYAPHWTFDHPGNQTGLHYSTFVETGRSILDYAKQHKNLNWVFKPHPHLREQLYLSGYMTKDEVDRYYNDWADIGEVFDGAGYADLFARSRAMITDCGSFLSEYGATGKPVIHLVSQKNEHVPPASIKKVYDTYYKVHNCSEMVDVFKMVLEDGSDPKYKARNQSLLEARLIGVDSGRRVLAYLHSELCGK